MFPWMVALAYLVLFASVVSAYQFHLLFEALHSGMFYSIMPTVTMLLLAEDLWSENETLLRMFGCMEQNGGYLECVKCTLRVP